MATANDIISTAFQLLGIYAPGETISSADSTVGLSMLNDMLDSWSNESLTCFATLEQSGTLQVGVSTYTIGTGGMFNMVRPLRILDGPGAAYILDTNGNRYGVDVIPQDQWNLIGSPTVTSNFPDTMFYDPQFPLGIINIFPIPSMSYVMYWDSYLQLTDFTSLSTAVSLPPGYKLALESNLALILHPFYSQAQINPIVVEMASQSKGNIKRTNLRANVAVYDTEIMSPGSSTYNIYTDNQSR